MTLQLMKIGLAKSIPISVGSIAIDRNGYSASGFTTISKTNPASDSGKITTIEVWANENITGLVVGTFHSTGTNQFSSVDYESIGNVTAGSKQTYSVNLDVGAGDYLGFYFASGKIEAGTGSANTEGEWDKSGNCFPCTNEAFTFYSFVTAPISLYGIGTT